MHALCLRADNVFHVVCPHHHREFESGYFVFVPSRRQRESMLEHELRNFAMREGIIARGGRDPGRSFPEVSSIGNLWLCGLADMQPSEAR